MKTMQVKCKNIDEFVSKVKELTSIQPSLVIAFGHFKFFESSLFAKTLADNFPHAAVVGCSTAGEISNEGVFDETLVITASHFDKTKFISQSTDIVNMDDSNAAGSRLGQKFDKNGLKAVFLLGRGLDINGSGVIDGLRKEIGDKVVITGGLAGDSGRFAKTFTLINGKVADNQVVAVGMYGEALQISFGSMGGWEAFGQVRRVTKSVNNVLFELDGEPALAVYKKYLGDKAKELPGSALLFPLQLMNEKQEGTGLVRTILAVDEKTQSMTFAGDIPTNGQVRMMKATNDNLKSGAIGAAKLAQGQASAFNPDGMGILISCVGRKLVMGADIEDETDAVRDIFGKSINLTGFYSYGEICPMDGFQACKLHNQTMTITYLAEK